jgi:hypothetical protein
MMAKVNALREWWSSRASEVLARIETQSATREELRPLFGQNVAADLQALKRFCREHRIPFGIIVTSNWTASNSNRAYFDSTMEWIYTLKDAIGKPQHVIFQSWQGPALSGANEIPINLPQNDPSNSSHVQLIIKGLDVFDQ